MEGVFHFKSWLLNAPELIHGGVYYRNFTVCLSQLYYNIPSFVLGKGQIFFPFMFLVTFCHLLPPPFSRHGGGGLLFFSYCLGGITVLFSITVSGELQNFFGI